MRNRPTGRSLYACAATALVMLAAAPVALAQFGTTTLRKGSHGHDVRVLQSWLDKLGYSTDIDGSFGDGTLRSVRQFEQHEGIQVDGIVDPSEAKLLRQRMNGDNSGSRDNSGSGGGTGGSGVNDTTPVSNQTPSTTQGAKAR